MFDAQTQDAMDWAITKLKSYDKEAKLYNISAIILSIFDVICGIIAIFYVSMQVTSVVASIICGTIWSGRCIQLIKAHRLAKALKVLSTASLAYIAVRKKRSEYMKKLLKNIKNNPLTIIFALLGGGIMAFSTYTIAKLYFITLPHWLYILFAVVVAIITIILVIVLGWDGAKSAILRSARKTLCKEDYNKVVDMVGTLEQIAKDTELAKQAENNKLKEVEQARAIIAEHDAMVQAYENAKKVVAESQFDDVEIIECK